MMGMGAMLVGQGMGGAAGSTAASILSGPIGGRGPKMSAQQEALRGQMQAQQQCTQGQAQGSVFGSSQTPVNAGQRAVNAGQRAADEEDVTEGDTLAEGDPTELTGDLKLSGYSTPFDTILPADDFSHQAIMDFL